MLTALVTFTLAATLIVLLPGPDTLVVLRNLMRHGRRRAGLTVAGVLCGLAVWVCAASLGLSALLRASHDAYSVLRLAGAAYLVWLGVQSLRAKRPALGTTGELTAAELTGAELTGAELTASGARRGALLGTGFGAGLATDLLNPKVGVFFVTFLPAFVPHGKPVAATSLLFGAIFIVLTAAYFALLLALAGRIVSWMRDPRLQRRLDRATGLVLVGFGLRLALEP
jgi:threonine/homoserine/homoserine lactone efflux protein